MADTTSDVTIRVKANAQQAVAEMTKLGHSIKNVKTSGEQTGMSFSKALDGMVVGLAQFNQALGGIEKGVALFTKAWDIAKERLQAQAREQQAFIQFGEAWTKKISQMSRGFAEDEAVVQSALKATRGELALNKAQFEIAIKVGANVARQGGDYVDTVEKVVRGIQGQTRGLRDLGIQIQETGTEQQKFNNLMRQLTEYAEKEIPEKAALRGMRENQAAIGEMLDEWADAFTVFFTWLLKAMADVANFARTATSWMPGGGSVGKALLMSNPVTGIPTAAVAGGILGARGITGALPYAGGLGQMAMWSTQAALERHGISRTTPRPGVQVWTSPPVITEPSGSPYQRPGRREGGQVRGGERYGLGDLSGAGTEYLDLTRPPYSGQIGGVDPSELGRGMYGVGQEWDDRFGNMGSLRVGTSQGAEGQLEKLLKTYRGSQGVFEEFFAARSAQDKALMDSSVDLLNSLGAVAMGESKWIKYRATIQAAWEGAQAISSLASGNYKAAALHTLAAIKFGMVAGLAGGGGGAGGGAGGGYMGGSRGGAGGSETINVYVGEGSFVEDPHALASLVARKVASARAAGRVRDDSDVVRREH